jgi:hypothetical protein
MLQPGVPNRDNGDTQLTLSGMATTASQPIETSAHNDASSRVGNRSASHRSGSVNLTV